MKFLYMIWPCSLLFINWLQGHLLPCPFKYITGADCPGCGFQRALIALLKGNLSESWTLYPATIPFLIAVLYTLADGQFRLDTQNGLFKKIIYSITACFMGVSYAVKMMHW